MINTKTLLQKELERLNALLSALPKTETGRPIGSLRVNLCKAGFTYYYETGVGINGKTRRTKERLGNGSAPRVRAIKRERYVRELRKRLGNNIFALRKAISTVEDLDFDSIVKALPAAFQVETDCYSAVSRFTTGGLRPPDSRSRAWMSAPYNKNPAEISRPHKTITGEIVRSKSEVIIYDLLVKYGVPFRYDCAITLVDHNGLEVVKYVDFMILTADGRIIFWEHLGKLSDDGYLSSNMAKMALYHKNGLTIGDNLILTSDAADWTINAEAIARMIENTILPLL